MVDLAQTIEEWKDLCSVKVDDQVRMRLIKYFIALKKLNLFSVFGRYLLLPSLRPHFGKAHRGHSGVQEPEKDGHHRRVRWAKNGLKHLCSSKILCFFRSLCQNQAPGPQGQENRQEEEDQRQDGQPQPILQRELRLSGRAGTASGKTDIFRTKYQAFRSNINAITWT